MRRFLADRFKWAANILLILGLFITLSCHRENAGNDTASNDKRELEARAHLTQLGLSFTKEEFFNQVTKGDLLAVRLFLEAGMDPNQTFDLAAFLRERGVIPVIPSMQIPILTLTREAQLDEVSALLEKYGASREAAEAAKIRVQQEEKIMNGMNRIILEAEREGREMFDPVNALGKPVTTTLPDSKDSQGKSSLREQLQRLKVPTE